MFKKNKEDEKKTKSVHEKNRRTKEKPPLKKMKPREKSKGVLRTEPACVERTEKAETTPKTQVPIPTAKQNDLNNSKFVTANSQKT